jgi:hypothetical protein
LQQWGTSDRVHPDDLHRVIQIFTQGIASGEPDVTAFDQLVPSSTASCARQRDPHAFADCEDRPMAKVTGALIFW